MKIKKLLSLIMVVTLVCSLTAACGGSGSSQAATGSTAGSTASSETPAGSTGSSRLDAIMASGKIVMATSPDYAPYEFVDVTKTGQESYAGSDIQLGYYIAEQLGVELVIEAMDFTAVQGAVSMGKVDMAISGFSYTDERAESMGLSDFYNLNRTENEQGMLVLATEADQYTKAEDFSGKKVAVQNASLQYNLLVEYLPEAVPEPITDLKDAVMMLISGKVDAVGVSAENGEAFAANYDDIVLSEFFYEHVDEGNVLAVPKGEDALLAKINEILAKVNEENLYAQWLADAQELSASL